MPFVTRNEAGDVVAMYHSAQSTASEELPAEHPDVIKFMQSATDESAAPPSASEKDLLAEVIRNVVSEQQSQISHTLDELSSSDLDMARVVEDLIEVLIQKQIIMSTDLPAIAMEKYTNRQSLRHKIKAIDSLIVEEKDII